MPVRAASPVGLAVNPKAGRHHQAVGTQWFDPSVKANCSSRESVSPYGCVEAIHPTLTGFDKLFSASDLVWESLCIWSHSLPSSSPPPSISHPRPKVLVCGKEAVAPVGSAQRRRHTPACLLVWSPPRRSLLSVGRLAPDMTQVHKDKHGKPAR